MFTSSIKRRIRKFHVLVVQWMSRKGTSWSVMHVQSWCYRCHGRRCCLYHAINSKDVNHSFKVLVGINDKETGSSQLSQRLLGPLLGKAGKISQQLAGTFPLAIPETIAGCISAPVPPLVSKVANYASFCRSTAINRSVDSVDCITDFCLFSTLFTEVTSNSPKLWLSFI